MKVLVAEDDRSLAEGLALLLRQSGFAVDIAATGPQADYLVATEHYDTVVLDLGLPGRDGLSLLHDWREQGRRVPVLILTARNRWPDKVAGFSAGADDYVPKPFEPMEVVLRVKALVRRSQGDQKPVITAGPLKLDTNLARVTLDGQPVMLTGQEYKLLTCLMLARGRVVSRTELAEHVYERDRDPDSNVIDVLISRIRRRIGRDIIGTLRGQGFMIAGDP